MAPQVSVSFFEKKVGDSSSLTLQIRDTGIGFIVEEKLRDYLRLGLHGMMERANMVGGILNIYSAVGSGTTIVGEFPSGTLLPGS